MFSDINMFLLFIVGWNGIWTSLLFFKGIFYGKSV